VAAFGLGNAGAAVSAEGAIEAGAPGNSASAAVGPSSSGRLKTWLAAAT